MPERKKLADKAITDKWLYRFINKVALPVAGVFSFIICHLLGGRGIQHERHNLDDIQQALHQDRATSLHRFSVFRGSLSVLPVQLHQHYFCRFMRHHFEKSDPTSAASKIVMFKNVMQVVIWGIWLMIALNVFQVGKSWLLAIFAGLSTGLGFASKDILGEHLLWHFSHDGPCEGW